MRIKIEVTQDNIDNGVCGSSHCCPVSMAIADATGRVASVGRESITTWENIEARCSGQHPTRKIHHVPVSVSRFVSVFDNDNADPKPFAFYLC